jgi:hypothetical protein
VQTATVAPYGSVSTGDSNQQPGVTQGAFGGNGYPVIQYEKTGLTLEFTPQVFPNLDVQVKMSIKSNDVTQTQGGPALTPTFTERNIEGTARIQNNRTMMIASVAQNSQSHGRQGLPVLGLVPILGRVFTAPRRNDSQTDIVIAVTPHVMRASSVTPEDEEMRPSGTLQTPTAGTLEAMLLEVTREEQLAAARAIPTHTNVELPEAETTGFVPAPKELMSSVAEQPAARPAARDAMLSTPVVTQNPTPAIPTPAAETPQPVTETPQPAAENSKPVAETPKPVAEILKPVAETLKPAAGGSLFSFEKQAQATTPAAQDSSTRAATRPRVHSTSATDSLQAGVPVSYITEKPTTDRAGATAVSAAALRLMSEPSAMRVGERRQLKVLLKTDAPLGLVALTFRLDPRLLAVRSVGAGTLSGPADARFTHTVTREGLLLVTVAPNASAQAISGAGVLLVFEVEALATGTEPLRFDADDVHLIATDGRKILLKVMTDQVSVRE